MRFIRFNIFLMSFLLVLPLAYARERQSREEYIKRYHKLAIREMKRTGIPASITMAQACLESGNGNSKLARKANNHFGIKCGSKWKGPRMRHDDDARKECFRRYPSAYDSFKDHSRFLIDNPRYSFLFSFAADDYVNWAHGLKKAGYATHPDYPALLIRIIEQHELHKLDKGKKIKKTSLAKKQQRKRNNSSNTSYVVKKGDTLYHIAQQHNTSVETIKRVNNIGSDNIQPGDVLIIK